MPLIAASLGIMHGVATWFHHFGMHLTPAYIAAGLFGTFLGSVSLRGVRHVRGPMLRVMLQRFLRTCENRGKFYDLVIGVNLGGADTVVKLLDERNRSGAAPVHWTNVDCSEVAKVQGHDHVHPNTAQITTLRRTLDRYAKHCPGEKLRWLIVCDESRTGGTVDCLRQRLNHPAVELEVLVVIRRPSCKGEIDWFFIESEKRNFLACVETPKKERPPCPLCSKRGKLLSGKVEPAQRIEGSGYLGLAEGI